ncbi:conserved hypothetical protein [sediment metagenome]|uniref:DUF4446 family protein n=1 Tax=sediment metagenome TaxID=749907 RepID=D9PI68_9ZZZZ
MPIDLNVITIVLGVLFAWTATLTILLVSSIRHYNRLTKNIAKKDLKSVLTDILNQGSLSQKHLESLEKQLKKMEIKSLEFVQKIGFVRFNPFNQTGGDQSFSLAILDAKDNGFVLSSLHSREATRFYAKTIKAGVSQGHELSKEERQAIKNAQD